MLIDTDVLVWMTRGHAGPAVRLQALTPWRISAVTYIPVSRAIAERAVSLPEHHKDPVDRIIIATAVEYQAQLISVDGRFPTYQELAGLLV